MVINTNMPAMEASRLLDTSNSALAKSLQRLSSGSRIISPEDDAAGLSQAAKLHNENLRDNATRTVLANGISFLQTKDGFLKKVHTALNRMSELSMLALDVTKSDTDRALYNTEFQQLSSFITGVSAKSFNGQSLFNSTYTRVNSAGITWSDAKAAAEAAGGHLATVGSAEELSQIMAAVGSGANLWIGLTDENSEGNFQWVDGTAASFTNWMGSQPDNSGGNQDYVKLSDLAAGQWDDDNNSGANIVGYVIESSPNLIVNGEMDSVTLDMGGLTAPTGDISTRSAATTALNTVKSAIQEIAVQRSNVGAMITRAQAESDLLAIKDVNFKQAISRILDTDVATESTIFARQSILTQAGTAMLAQANALPQSALRLLN
ncbi:MAG TPA: flagellin [Verrucomicrobiae bacterium]